MASFVAAAAAVGIFAAGASAQGTSGGPEHIFFIMMENQAAEEIIGNEQYAPFINKLADQNRLATNFHGVTHPSLPNYLAAVSGSYQGIFDDCEVGANVTCEPEEFVPNSGDGTSGISLTPEETETAEKTPHLFSGKNIVDQLESAGISWKAYMEDLPYPGSQAVAAPVVDGQTVKLYAEKHDPFMYFSDINYPGSQRLKDIVPFEHRFLKELKNGTVPNYSFIVPNQCHDMHGISPSSAELIGLPACGYPEAEPDNGPIQLGDQWLKKTVGAIKRSPAWQGNSEIIISWDENDYDTDTSGGPFSPVGAEGKELGGGLAPTIVVSSQHPGHVVNNTPTDHYSTLDAIQQMWHLGCLANTCRFTNEEYEQFKNLFN